jgi:hypothetical protein
MHFSRGDRAEWSEIWDSFLLDIERSCPSDDTPHLILFTGDFVYSADEKGIYCDAMEKLLEIAAKAGVPESRVIVAPGNHDVSQAWVKEHLTTLEGFRVAATSRSSAAALFKTSELSEYVEGALGNFNEALGLLEHTALVQRNDRVEVHVFDDLKVGVVCLNTSALSLAGIGPADADRGALAVNEFDVLQAFKRVPDGYAVIAMGHHPLDWLNEGSRAALEPIFTQKSVAYLHGHMHDAQPRALKGLRGSCLFSQAGALFTGRDYYNGYALLTVHIPTADSKVDFRSYFPKRQEFDIGVDQSERGVFYASEAAAVRWRVPDSEALTLGEWKREMLLPFLADEFNVSLSDAPLDEVFVEPEFELERLTKRKTEASLVDDSKILSFCDIVDAGDNYVITAAGESGKSSLLKQWAIRSARRQCKEDKYVPVLLNFSEIPSYRPKTLSLIRSKLPPLPDGTTLDNLIDAGSLLFLIDDVDFHNEKGQRNLEYLFGLCEKCRFVMTTGTQLLASPAVEPLVLEAVPLTRITLRPIRTGQVRALIEKLGVKDPLQADQILNRMYRESMNLAVPLTPVTGTFLIQIYSSREGEGLLNRASLIERFIEIQLDKFAVSDLVPGAFDFRNKAHLLSFIAERMVREGKYDVPVAELLFWIGEYLNHHGFTYSSQKLLKYFVSARVLQEECDFVRFRLKAFMEFFVASRMQADEDFCEYILDEERYLSFINEIAFYSAITRDDGGILDRIHARFVDTFDLCTLDGEPIRVKAAALDKLEMPKSKATLEDLQELESQIVSRKLTQDERDLILDRELTRFTGEDQKIRRTVLATEDGRSVALLVLISAMLKNTDLIPNAKKKAILTDVIDAWAAFAALSLSLVPSISEHKKFYFEGVQYRLTLGDDLATDEVARRLMFVMPIAVARLAFYNVGTEKLRRQLEEGIGSTESLANQFIRFSLLADLGLPGIGRVAQKTAAVLKPSKYLANVLVRKFHELLLRFRLAEEDVEKVREITADVMVSLAGQRGRVAGERKGRMINSMKQRELTLKINRPDALE